MLVLECDDNHRVHRVKQSKSCSKHVKNFVTFVPLWLDKTGGHARHGTLFNGLKHLAIAGTEDVE